MYVCMSIMITASLLFWFPSLLDYSINHVHEKLLDSDWLRAVQLKCNTSAKSVTPHT